MPDFDSWRNYRHEWKEQGSLDLLGVLKKCFGKWAILGPKMAYPHNWIHFKIFFKNFAQRIGPIDRLK